MISKQIQEFIQREATRKELLQLQKAIDERLDVMYCDEAERIIEKYNIAAMNELEQAFTA